MISQEEFVKRTLDSFDSIRTEFKLIREEIDEKHSNTCGKLAELGKKYAELHEKIAVHLKVEEELEEYKRNEKALLQADLDRKDTKRDRKFYVIMALMGLGFTLFEIGSKYFGY